MHDLWHIPLEGIAVILGVDRLLDMAGTTVNVGGDLMTAVVVHDSTSRESDGREVIAGGGV
jgi:Na+/H+-dicarboxylate symporter